MKTQATSIRAMVLSTSLFAGCAIAQPAAENLGPEMQGQMLGGPMRHDLLFAAGTQLEQERVVQGAPYCADATHETVHSLADGNRIVQRQTSRQCRDGQGRTRQEVTTRAGQTHVYLRDPIAKEAWLLDGDRKLAVRIDLPRHPLAPAEPHLWERVIGLGHVIREKLHLKLGGGEAPVPPAVAAAPVPPEPVHVAMRIAPMHDSAMPPPIALHARLLGPRGPGVTQLLPGDTVEGVRADGKRTTWTIEAGRLGNEKPITIVNEVWSSPELGITLKTHDVDPVVGEDTFTVRNIVRGEPEAQLFRVPADYAKVTAPTRARP